MFVHGGLAHLGRQHAFLWIFGDNVEDRLGHGRFIVFYCCAASPRDCATALNADSLVPMVGASGAIAGVMGAYLVLYPRSRVLMLFPFPVFLFELPAVVFLVMWFLVQFLNGDQSAAGLRTTPSPGRRVLGARDGICRGVDPGRVDEAAGTHPRRMVGYDYRRFRTSDCDI